MHAISKLFWIFVIRDAPALNTVVYNLFTQLLVKKDGKKLGKIDPVFSKF